MSALIYVRYGYNNQTQNLNRAGDYMGEISRPIQRSILIGCAVFAVLLCIALSIPASMVISSALYERYETDLLHALNGVEAQIDKDDLHNCYVTNEMSQKYQDLQAFLNEYVDLYELEYLYCVVPDVKNVVMRNVISATSAAERAEGATDMPLNDTSDAYGLETLQRYDKLLREPGISYFEEDSEWGAFYTACLPLKTSSGETFAMLCADIPIDTLHKTVNTYTMTTVAITVLISAVFSFLLAMWMRRNVTKPIAKLEESTRNFAETSHDATDPNSILFTAPEINTKNEVESLSDAITRMAADMRAYVFNAVSAEERARSAEEEAEGMTAIAYQDALTQVKSKAAFETIRGTLIDANWSGDEGDNPVGEASGVVAEDGTGSPDAVEFGLIMVDANGLKTINDTYGHDHGDRYIVGTCHTACDVFKHSPVYRIGGDEFVIVLKGSAYRDREALVESLHDRFRATESDLSRDPWERYSAAIGLAVYDPQTDESVDDVLRRADIAMYENKRAHKAKAAPN